MSPFRQPAIPPRKRRGSPYLYGSLTGAAVGGLLRLAVAVLFVVIANQQGGWWGGGDSMMVMLPFCLVSGGVGLVIGAAGGSTCRPIFGAIVGTALSAGSCLFLFVLPVNVMLNLSGGGSRPYTEERGLIILGLIAMSVAGAISGAVGGAAGGRVWRAQEAEAQGPPPRAED